MKTNTYVTVWHLDESTGMYLRSIYKARAFLEKRLAKSGIKQKGFFSGSRATLRIPLDQNAKVELGDYVRCDISYDEAPDRIGDLKVMQIAENNFGTNPHIRLQLGRSSERS